MLGLRSGKLPVLILSRLRNFWRLQCCNSAFSGSGSNHPLFLTYCTRHLSIIHTRTVYIDQLQLLESPRECFLLNSVSLTYQFFIYSTKQVQFSLRIRLVRCRCLLLSTKTGPSATPGMWARDHVPKCNGQEGCWRRTATWWKVIDLDWSLQRESICISRHRALRAAVGKKEECGEGLLFRLLFQVLAILYDSVFSSSSINFFSKEMYSSPSPRFSDWDHASSLQRM